jgi:hypothetical protein
VVDVQRRVVADRLLVLLLQLRVGELLGGDPLRDLLLNEPRTSSRTSSSDTPLAASWLCKVSPPTFFWKALNALVTFASSTVSP